MPDLTDTSQEAGGRNALHDSHPPPFQSQAEEGEGGSGGQMGNKTMLPKSALPFALGPNK